MAWSPAPRPRSLGTRPGPLCNKLPTASGPTTECTTSEQTAPPPADPPRRVGGVGRFGNDGEPGAAGQGRRIRDDANAGAGGGQAAGLRAEPDCGRLGLEPGEPCRGHHPLARQHGLSRSAVRHLGPPVGHRAAARRGRHRLPARARGEGPLRDAVVAALGRHHRRARAFRRLAGDARGGGMSGGRDHGRGRRSRGRLRRHQPPPGRAQDGRGHRGTRLPADRVPRNQDAARLPGPQNGSRASPGRWASPASRSRIRSSIPAVRRWPRVAR